jgi:hypothetical protein
MVVCPSCMGASVLLDHIGSTVLHGSKVEGVFRMYFCPEASITD